jgi:hypothetical protein
VSTYRERAYRDAHVNSYAALVSAAQASASRALLALLRRRVIADTPRVLHDIDVDRRIRRAQQLYLMQRADGVARFLSMASDELAKRVGEVCDRGGGCVFGCCGDVR